MHCLRYVLNPYIEKACIHEQLINSTLVQSSMILFEMTFYPHSIRYKYFHDIMFVLINTHYTTMSLPTPCHTYMCGSFLCIFHILKCLVISLTASPLTVKLNWIALWTRIRPKKKKFVSGHPTNPIKTEPTLLFLCNFEEILKFWNFLGQF